MAANNYFRLLNGSPTPDISFDHLLINSTDEKAANAGSYGSPDGTNVFMTTTDPRVPTTDQTAALANAPNALSASNPVADKQYVDQLKQGVDWQDSVTHNVNYVKTTTGAPTGTPSTGEKCVNTFDNVLYEESGGSWDAGTAATTNDRYIFKNSGTDTTGNSGTYTANNEIYTYDGSSTTGQSPNEGWATWVEDQDALYIFNTSWSVFGSVTTHNNLSGLQGGNGSTEYYHLTADQEAAADAANSPSATNPFLVQSDLARATPVYSFIYRGGFPASTSNFQMKDQSGARNGYLAPRPGYIVSSTIASTEACTGGTFTFEPSINGTAVTPTGLDIQLNNSTHTTENYAAVAYGTAGYSFVAGQYIGGQGTSDGSWATSGGTEDLSGDVYVVFSS